MTQIAATDAALVRLIDNCGFPGVDRFFERPHSQWDGGLCFETATNGRAPAILRGV